MGVRKDHSFDPASAPIAKEWYHPALAGVEILRSRPSINQHPVVAGSANGDGIALSYIYEVDLDAIESARRNQRPENEDEHERPNPRDPGQPPASPIENISNDETDAARYDPAPPWRPRDGSIAVGQRRGDARHPANTIEGHAR